MWLTIVTDIKNMSRTYYENVNLFNIRGKVIHLSEQTDTHAGTHRSALLCKNNNLIICSLSLSVRVYSIEDMMLVCLCEREGEIQAEVGCEISTIYSNTGHLIMIYSPWIHNIFVQINEYLVDKVVLIQ